MATNITWTDETWNPVIGCTRVSSGCDNCYAFALHDKRHVAWSRGRWAMAPEQYHRPFSQVQLLPKRLDVPLHWRTPRRVFVNSMSDLFHEIVPDAFIDRVFATMAITGATRHHCRAGKRCTHENNEPGCWRKDGGRQMPVHTYQILTKRPARMLAYMQAAEREARVLEALNDPEWSTNYEEPELIAEAAGWPLRNVWLGVSVENQQAAEERIPWLLKTPAAVRFISAEPLLGNLAILPWLERHDPQYGADGSYQPPSLDWVIVGGESGGRRRDMNHEWVRLIRAQCEAAGVAYFGKQDSGPREGVPLPGALGDREFPTDPGFFRWPALKGTQVYPLRVAP